MCKWLRALAKALSLMPRCGSAVSFSEAKNASSVTCCDCPRIDSNEAINPGKGSLRQRVNALG